MFNAGTGVSFVLYDGIPAGNTSNDAFAVFPSLVGNKIRNNGVITTSPVSATYTALPRAPVTTDTLVSGNVAYSTGVDYANTHGGVNSARTLKTYLQSVGVTVTSIDGVHEAVAIFNTMDRNNWPAQYSAAAINSYIREGFGFTVPA